LISPIWLTFFSNPPLPPLQLIDVFEDDKYVHLVQELCTGGEVFERILDDKNKGGGYSEKDAALVMRKVLDAIDYCHRVHNVCHR